MSFSRWFILLTLSICAFPGTAQCDDQTPLPARAETALWKACSFFREQVSCEGGYLWRYSADLTKCEGEGIADEDTVWVQPPGTPAVGQALLEDNGRTGFIWQPLLMQTLPAFTNGIAP